MSSSGRPGPGRQSVGGMVGGGVVGGAHAAGLFVMLEADDNSPASDS